MNSVQLIGNLTRDPEVITTSNDNTICKFTVAVSRKYTNADGERESDFIYCTAFKKTAEIIGKYFSKGSKIGVEGSIQNNNYTDKDGVQQYKTGVIVNDITFIDKKSDGETKGETPKKNTQIKTTSKKTSDSEEDLPF